MNRLLATLFVVLVFTGTARSSEEPPAARDKPATPCEGELLRYLKRDGEKLSVDWAGLAAYGMDEKAKDTPGLLCRARAAFLYADLAPAAENPESEKYYKRARALALQALRSRERSFRLRDTYRDVPGNLAGFDTQDALALSWFSVSWGHVLDRLSFWTAASQAKDVEKLMLRVSQLAPGIESAGAEVFLATYYFSLPKLWGQDTKKALRYADIALATASLNNCRIAILQTVLGLELPVGKREELKKRRAKPVDYSAPFAFENAVCQ